MLTVFFSRFRIDRLCILIGLFVISIPIAQNAFHFDGIDERVTIPHTWAFDFSNEFMVEAWIKRDGLQSGTILSKYAAFSYHRRFVIVAKTDGSIEFTISTNGVNEKLFIVPSAYSNDQWTHIALSYDGTILKGYVNGVIGGIINIGGGSVFSPFGTPIEIGVVFE